MAKITFWHDGICNVCISDGDSVISVSTKCGKTIQYHESKVSIIGIRATGVKAINLDSGDEITSLVVLNKNDRANILFVTDKGGARVYNSNSVTTNNRTTKPSELFKFYRTEPHYLVDSIKLAKEYKLFMLNSNGQQELIFDDKTNIIGKSIKNTIGISANDRIIAISNPKLLTIDESFKTYHCIKEATVVKAVKEEEDSEKYNNYIDLL